MKASPVHYPACGVRLKISAMEIPKNLKLNFFDLHDRYGACLFQLIFSE
jgi:hypothetical protein